MRYEEIKKLGLEKLEAVDPNGYQMESGEAILASVIKFLLLENEESRKELKEIMGCVVIKPNFSEKSIERQRRIDFQRLLMLTDEAVKLGIVEGEKTAAEQLKYGVHFADQAVQVLKETNVKYQLQNAGTRFYDFLVDCVHAVE